MVGLLPAIGGDPVSRASGTGRLNLQSGIAPILMPFKAARPGWK